MERLTTTQEKFADECLPYLIDTAAVNFVYPKVKFPAGCQHRKQFSASKGN